MIIPVCLCWPQRKILEANCCGKEKTVCVPRSSGVWGEGHIPVLPKKISTEFILFLGYLQGGEPAAFPGSVGFGTMDK